MANENQTTRYYLPMKNEDAITEQAVRVMGRATNRNRLEALVHPETEAEHRVARAYNRELAAHRKALKWSRKDDGRMTSYQERVRMKSGYWGEGGHFVLTAIANGKEIDTPFGRELYCGECNKEHLEQAQWYARGIVMGMFCKYKHPQIILTWWNNGVGTCMGDYR